MILKHISCSQSRCNVTNITNVTFEKEDLSKVKITPTDISEVIIEKYGYTEANSRRVGRILKTLGITTKREKINGKTKNVVVLEGGELLKLMKKYVPASIWKDNASYESYESYVSYDKGDSQNSISIPIEK